MNYKENVYKVISIYERKHVRFYSKKTKEEIETFIENYFSNNEVKCDEDFLYLIRVIIKEALGEHDSHTTFTRKEKKMPFLFKFLNDGFYVINAYEGFEKYLYSKLVSVNGVDLDIIMKDIDRCTCYSTKGWLDVEAEEILRKSGILTLPCLSKDKIVYKLLTDNGVESIEVDKNKVYPYNYHPAKYDNYHISINNDSLVLTYSSCKDESRMNEAVSIIKREVMDKNINNFILDLRCNEGGISRIILPLIEFLKESNLNLITLVDRRVFSSGRWALLDMKNIGSTIIGEEIGTSLNAYGEPSSEDIDINNIKYNIRCSTKYFDGQDESFGETDSFNIDFNKKELVFIHPDLFVNETIDDIKNGRDVYLYAALNYLDNLNNKRS